MLRNLSMKLDSFDSWSSRGNSSMKIREFGLGLFKDIVALDVSYPRKFTLHNLEFQNSCYGLITDKGLGQTLLDNWSSSR